MTINSILIIFLVLNSLTYLFYNKFSKLINIYDHPNKKRKIHRFPTPLLGGFILFVNIIVFYIINLSFFNNQFSDHLYFQSHRQEIIFLLSIISFFLIGVFDDKYSISATKKFVISFLIFFVIARTDNNIVISDIKFISIDKVILLDEIGIYLSIFCFLSLSNAMNMFDGINLQLSLYSIFIFLILIFFYKVVFFPIIFLIALILISILNSKNKLFLGESGVLLISFSLSYILIKEYNYSSKIKCDEIFLLLLYPGIDMIRLFVVRLYKGLNPFKGDRNHIHHLLLKFFSYKKTTAIIFFSYAVPIISYVFLNNYLIFFLLLQLLIYFSTYYIISIKSKK